MERRVKSWINKKIVEYIGEEEPSLCGFICSKVLAKSQPENILQDVAIVSITCNFLLVTFFELSSTWIWKVIYRYTSKFFERGKPRVLISDFLVKIQ